MIDDLELKIINLLQKDSRQTNRSIAKQLGASESTVRRRIDNLVAKGLIRFTVVLNPEAASSGISTYILINTDPSQIEDIASKVAKISIISSLVILSGDPDIIAVGYFKSIDHIREVVHQEISNMPGVKSIRTQIIMKRLKRSY